MTRKDDSEALLERVLAGGDTPQRRAIHARHFAGGVPRKLSSAFERLPLQAGRTLDLGCGWGVYTARLAPGSSVGLDLDPQRVEFVRSLGVEARCVDLRDASWSAELGHFDFIWACDILPHMQRPARLLRQMREVLAPGGSILISDWLWPSHSACKRAALALPGARAVHDEPQHFHAPTRALLDEWLREAELLVVDEWIPSFSRAWQRKLVAPIWPPRTLQVRAR